MSEQPIWILEDSPEDLEVLERAFRKVEFEVPLLHYRSAREALMNLQELSKLPRQNAEYFPALILLDLNMPDMDGFHFIQKIKENSLLKTIPVIVLSTSHSQTDVAKSYEFGANSYVPKPEDMKGYVQMADVLKSYWFSLSLLPLDFVYS